MPKKENDFVAQLAEQLDTTQEAKGSNPFKIKEMFSRKNWLIGVTG